MYRANNFGEDRRFPMIPTTDCACPVAAHNSAQSQTSSLSLAPGTRSSPMEVAVHQIIKDTEQTQKHRMHIGAMGGGGGGAMEQTGKGVQHGETMRQAIGRSSDSIGHAVEEEAKKQEGDSRDGQPGKAPNGVGGDNTIVCASAVMQLAELHAERSNALEGAQADGRQDADKGKQRMTHANRNINVGTQIINSVKQVIFIKADLSWLTTAPTSIDDTKQAAGASAKQAAISTSVLIAR